MCASFVSNPLLLKTVATVAQRRTSTVNTKVVSSIPTDPNELFSCPRSGNKTKCGVKFRDLTQETGMTQNLSGKKHSVIAINPLPTPIIYEGCRRLLLKWKKFANLSTILQHFLLSILPLYTRLRQNSYNKI